jgi:hypothetical protein
MAVVRGGTALSVRVMYSGVPCASCAWPLELAVCISQHPGSSPNSTASRQGDVCAKATAALQQVQLQAGSQCRSTRLVVLFSCCFF